MHGPMGTPLWSSKICLVLSRDEKKKKIKQVLPGKEQDLFINPQTLFPVLSP